MRSLIAAAMLAALSLPAGAQTLRIGMSAVPTSVDPHHYALTPNGTLRAHLFDALTDVDANLKLSAALATGWTRRDDLTWVLTLRQGVTFSDGAPFTSADVVFSYCRVLNNETEMVGSFSRIARRIERIDPVGAYEVVFTTREPEPLFLTDLSNIVIIPRGLGRGTDGLVFGAETKCAPPTGATFPTLTQFNDGTATIGTGPYRMRGYTANGVIELVRNDRYWGEKPHWESVRLSPVTQAAPRVAALLAGDLDVIEAPATADLPRLRSSPAVAVSVMPTTRLIFLQLDLRENAPFVTAAGGGNPLRDVRVRRALSLAIDRRAIVERIMDGVASPAIQFLPDGMRGTIPELKVPEADLATARRLMSEAGVANGFAITLHATNNRYVNDARVAQALAQAFSRIGVRVEVDAMPSTTFFPRRGRSEFSVAMGGWAADAEETMLFFRAWLMTMIRDRGLGMSNYGFWSDAAFDGAAIGATTTMDEAKRDALMVKASRRALDQLPVIPIHFESAVWAMRRGLAYAGRVDQLTLAQDIRPVSQ